jgi:hypothetical protein
MSIVRIVSSTESVVCVGIGEGRVRVAVADDADDRGGLGRLAEGPHDLLVARRVADQQDVVPVARVLLRLGVHLGDQGAGRVEGGEPAPRRLGAHRRTHPVGAEHHGVRERPSGVRGRGAHRVEVGEVLDEVDAHLPLEPLDDGPVVDDRVEDGEVAVAALGVLGRGLADRVDRHHDAGAEPTGFGEVQGFDHGSHGTRRVDTR